MATANATTPAKKDDHQESDRYPEGRGCQAEQGRLSERRSGRIPECRSKVAGRTRSLGVNDPVKPIPGTITTVILAPLFQV